MWDVPLVEGFTAPIRRLAREAPSPARKIPWKQSAPSSTLLLQPWIHANDNWGNWAILTFNAASAQHLGRSTALGKLLGPPVTAMFLSFAMASVGIINPGSTVAAKSLQTLSLSLATPLVLLGADLRDAVQRSGPLLISFILAAASTALACILGWNLFGNAMKQALGRDALIIAAALMAVSLSIYVSHVPQPTIHEISFNTAFDLS